MDNFLNHSQSEQSAHENLLIDESSESILNNLCNSISQPFVFSNSECGVIESLVYEVIRLGNIGHFKQHTVDRTLLRNKYFFGERYTYGTQMSQKGPGMEQLFPKSFVDPIPAWMYHYVINPLVEAKIIDRNFINSAVINEYQPGGCIVSHIDPPHIFDRPIISVSLISDCRLCFGCKFEFKPIRCSEPIFKLALPRGAVTLISGYAADEITHCVRPQDTKFYRAVIVLRRVLPDAPRLLQVDNLLTSANLNVATGSKLNPTKMTELNGGVLKKFYEKYSKSCKGKRNLGGISKPLYGRKTFFADNNRYANKPYAIDKD